MLRPELDTVIALSGEYKVVPVCKEFYADEVTPINLLRRIAGLSRRFFLLESIEGGERWGRYSFLGFDPVMSALDTHHACHSDCFLAFAVGHFSISFHLHSRKGVYASVTQWQSVSLPS